MKKPDSMDECLYFTRRTIGDGHIVAWALKKECPECKKALMGKPIGKEGKVKIRASEYVCPECGHTEQKKEHEATLTLSVEYTCPHCKHKGESETKYQRKSFQGVQSFIIACDNCGEKIPITKKMKEPKKKK
ncbi:hypothetical protein K9M79_00195 [Candidatus Woesearchaeota archaeon]|nr:hypothetical protein [Candidatus Woesearchaeota archaeon]